MELTVAAEAEGGEEAEAAEGEYEEAAEAEAEGEEEAEAAEGEYEEAAEAEGEGEEDEGERERRRGWIRCYVRHEP